MFPQGNQPPTTPEVESITEIVFKHLALTSARPPILMEFHHLFLRNMPLSLMQAILPRNFSENMEKR